MSIRRPISELERLANLASSNTQVLTTSEERALIQELTECKRKLAQALCSVEGRDVPPDSSPRATAHFIAEAYSGKGPDQARLGAVYRRYSELRGELALANIKLVAHVAKRFRERGIPYSDLMQEGFCGLLEAIDRFDMGHETKLATYATWWIRQSMQQAVATGAYPVRLTPRHLRQLARSQSPREHQESRRSDSESSGPAGSTGTDLIERIHTATQPAISLDATYDSHSGAGFSLIQTMCDPDGDRTIDVETDETIEKLMQLLRPREQQVLALRFGLAGQDRLSLTQAGKILAVSKERVRQIEQRAIKKLRDSVEQQAALSEGLPVQR